MIGLLEKVRAKQYHNQITGQQGNSRPGPAPRPQLAWRHESARGIQRHVLARHRAPGQRRVCAHLASVNEAIKFSLTLTHEEVAQTIGASRETVTRLFADFKKRNLLQIEGASFTIADTLGIERLLQES
jgi:CRP-like cAMP-binding protein